MVYRGLCTPFSLLLSFDKHNNSGGETAASPKGCISIHLLMYSVLGNVLLRIEMAGQFIETGRPGRYRITKIERFRVLDTEDADLA